MTTLSPMTEPELGPYLEEAVAGYAEDNVRSGRWKADEALALSRAEFGRLLPQGLATAGQHLFTIRDDAGAPVGAIWLAEDRQGSLPRGFIYDLVVAPAHRRRGHGRAAMLLIEEVARGLGLSDLGLHVFGFNVGARALYESLGYEITHLNMAKALG